MNILLIKCELQILVILLVLIICKALCSAASHQYLTSKPVGYFDHWFYIFNKIFLIILYKLRQH
jgi:hypothetical protein